MGKKLKLTEEQESRVTMRRPLSMPVFALWVPDGGPDLMGHWLVDITDSNDDDHPAVFFDRELAERVAAEERKEGLACEVIELRAVEGKR